MLHDSADKADQLNDLQTQTTRPNKQRAASLMICRQKGVGQGGAFSFSFHCLSSKTRNLNIWKCVRDTKRIFQCLQTVPGLFVLHRESVCTSLTYDYQHLHTIHPCIAGPEQLKLWQRTMHIHPDI